MQMYRKPKIEKDGESSPDSIDTTNLKQAQVDNNKSIFSIDDSTQAPETRSSSDHDDIAEGGEFEWSFPFTTEESEIFLGLSIIAGTIESVIRRRNEGIQNSYTKQHKSHTASQQPFNIHRTSRKFIPHPPPTRPIVDSGDELITTQNKHDTNNSHSPQNEELIQESMEKVVGGLANVSHTLEIEVEYLRELVSKVDRLEHKLDSVHHERDKDSTMKAGNGTNSVYVTGSKSIDMIESKLDDRSDLMSDMSEEPKEAIVDVATSVDGNLSSDVKMDETVSEADRVFTKMDDGVSSMTEDADDNHDFDIDKTLAQRNDKVLCESVSQVETVNIQDENMIESAQTQMEEVVMSVSDSRSKSEMFESQDLTTTNTTSSVTERNETTLSTVVSEVILDDSSLVLEDEDKKTIESAQALVNVTVDEVTGDNDDNENTENTVMSSVSDSGSDILETQDLTTTNTTSSVSETNETTLSTVASEVILDDSSLVSEDEDEKTIESAQVLVNATVDAVTGDNDDNENTKNTVMSVSDSGSESEMLETQDLTTTNTTSSVSETNETTLSTVLLEVTTVEVPDDSSFVLEDEDEKTIESVQALVNMSGAFLAEQHEETEELVAVDNSSDVVGVDLSVIKKDEEEAEEIVEDGMVGSNMTEAVVDKLSVDEVELNEEIVVAHNDFKEKDDVLSAAAIVGDDSHLAESDESSKELSVEVDRVPTKIELAMREDDTTTDVSPEANATEATDLLALKEQEKEKEELIGLVEIIDSGSSLIDTDDSKVLPVANIDTTLDANAKDTINTKAFVAEKDDVSKSEKGTNDETFSKIDTDEVIETSPTQIAPTDFSVTKGYEKSLESSAIKRVKEANEIQIHQNLIELSMLESDENLGKLLDDEKASDESYLSVQNEELDEAIEFSIIEQDEIFHEIISENDKDFSVMKKEHLEIDHTEELNLKENKSPRLGEDANDVSFEVMYKIDPITFEMSVKEDKSDGVSETSEDHINLQPYLEKEDIYKRNDEIEEVKKEIGNVISKETDEKNSGVHKVGLSPVSSPSVSPSAESTTASPSSGVTVTNPTQKFSPINTISSFPSVIPPKTYSPRFTFTPRAPPKSDDTINPPSDLGKPSDTLEGVKSILSVVDMESESLSKEDKEKAEYAKNLLHKIEKIEKELGISSEPDPELHP